MSEPWCYPLFRHMSDNHGLTLIDSELHDIIEVVRSIIELKPKKLHRDMTTVFQTAGAGLWVSCPDAGCSRKRMLKTGRNLYRCSKCNTTWELQ